MVKRFVLLFAFVVCICGILINFNINGEKSYRSFEFRGGFSNSGGGYERNISHVLVNETSYDLEDLYDNIYDQYILMNGEPDELTLYLYNSEEKLHSSHYFSTKSYKK